MTDIVRAYSDKTCDVIGLKLSKMGGISRLRQVRGTVWRHTTMFLHCRFWLSGVWIAHVMMWRHAAAALCREVWHAAGIILYDVMSFFFKCRAVCMQLGFPMKIEDTWGSEVTAAVLSHLAHSTPEKYRWVVYSLDWHTCTCGSLDITKWRQKQHHGQPESFCCSSIKCLRSVCLLYNPNVQCKNCTCTKHPTTCTCTVQVYRIQRNDFVSKCTCI